jgi:hypothetical protein
MYSDDKQAREKLRAHCVEKIRNMVIELHMVHNVMDSIGVSYSVLNFISHVQDELDKLMYNVEMADVTLGLED